MIRRQPRFPGRRQGATSVEFAMTIPILLLIVFGGIEFGRASMLRHTADHAAYVAARHAITPGASVDDVRQQAADHLDAHGVSDYVITVSPDPITYDTTLVEVSVSFPASSNSFVVPDYLSGDIHGNCEMITERPPIILANALPEPPPPPAPPTFPTRPTFPTIPTFPTTPTFPTSPTSPTSPSPPTTTMPTAPPTTTRPTPPPTTTRPTAPPAPAPPSPPKPNL